MIKQHYEIDNDNRKFDNPIDAVQAATEVSTANGGMRIKVYRSVTYTGETEANRYTLTVVEMPTQAAISKFATEQTGQPPVLSGTQYMEPVPSSISPTPNTPTPNSLTQNNFPAFRPCTTCGRK